MDNLADMIWIETKKALRSRMPLWTSLGSLFLPLGIAFLIFVSRNPEISRKLGLISTKANLIAYSATDWTAYLGLFGQIVAAGGFFLFVLIVSWVFGREFADGTIKDILAVPVQRSSIILAKFIVTAAWSIVLTMVILIAGLATGAVIHLPEGSFRIILQGSIPLIITACLVIVSIMPFSFLASAGRGYLLPMGAAVLTLMMANITVLIGWGEYFPWAVPGLYVQGKGSLAPASFWIVVLTGLAGMMATSLWWKYADQTR